MLSSSSPAKTATSIYIDAGTGKERKVNDDDDCDDHNGKHKHKKGRGHYRHGEGHGYAHHYHCHCDCDNDHDGDDHDDDDNHHSDSTAVGIAIITGDSAQTIAATMLDSAQVTNAKLRVQSGSVIWYIVQLKRDSNTYELTIDARTGMLVEAEQESGDFNNSEFKPTNTNVALIALSQARAAATANLVGNAIAGGVAASLFFALCALGLATPIALVAGASAAARKGLILADHAALESGASITQVAFDKTGTLTEGKPSLVAVHVAAGSEDEALQLAARLAAHSDHPIDTAIVAGARARGIFRDGIDDFAAVSGGGLAGASEEHSLRLGSKAYIDPPGSEAAAIAALEATLEATFRALPARYLAVDGRIRAILIVGDPLRTTSKEAIADLHHLGVATIMLSGDRQEVVGPVALELGIDDARGGLKPEDKLAVLNGIVEKGGRLAFVGDT